jgi:diguanylate cyclase (GGDEF)-like protein
VHLPEGADSEHLLRQLRIHERRFRTVFDHAPSAMLVVETDTWTVREANATVLQLLPIETQTEGSALLSLVEPATRPAVEAQLTERQDGRVMRIEVAMPRRDGSVAPASLILVPCGDDEAIVVISEGGSQSNNAEILAHMAFHDPLTGLANRSSLMTRLERVMAHSERDQPSMAVLYIDLDDFKIVNDSLGHSAGDAFLVETARRLLGCVGPGDMVARLGGDEFTIILTHTQDTDDAIRVAELALQELQQPFLVEGYRLVITPSVGIVMGNQAGNAKELLGYADIAMYQAKQKGKARYEAFSPRMHQEVLHRLQLESDLRRAVELSEFSLVYQPIFHLASMQITSVEALIRWNRPGHGQVPPGEFIPVAEATGLILPIGRWVLREACREARAWQSMCPGLVVCVNLSARQFQEPFLTRQVEEILADTGLDPRCLTLEITETVLVQDPDYAGTVLAELKALEVSVALDDFGTGYSSLNYLQRFPIDILKIDRSFVKELGQSERDDALVQSVIILAGALQLRVTAEGLETAQQIDRLMGMASVYGQGYALGRPAPASEMTQRLRQQTGNESPKSEESGALGVGEK